MTKKAKRVETFNIVIVAQQGRLMYEALIFCASLRANDPGFDGRLLIAEPQNGPRWNNAPEIRNDAVRNLLSDEYGAEFLPFENHHFGQSYPHGNKIEALLSVPDDRPFVFFDTDTLITGPVSSIPFDFDKPSASRRVEGSWPKPDLYGPGYADIWKSLYDRFGLEFESSLDLSQPEEYWDRFLYFNAGWFFHRNAKEFGERFRDYALAISQEPGETLASQTLFPWLDQIALPLVIHSLGGARETLPSGLLDGERSCHYRNFSLLYARENDEIVEKLESVTAPNKLKKVLKQYEPAKRMIYQARGHKLRVLFDRTALPTREQPLRQRIKKSGFWMA